MTQRSLNTSVLTDAPSNTSFDWNSGSAIATCHLGSILSLRYVVMRRRRRNSKMKILTYKPSRRLALVLHMIFASIYLLLGTRAVISLYEAWFFHVQAELAGCFDYQARERNIVSSVLLVFVPASVESNADLIEAIVFAIAFYTLIHYGMLMNVPDQGSIAMTDRILKLCRAIFFLAGALLLLLIVARMSVMLHQDIRFGRGQWGIASPAKK
jgi:hypothetical protein